MKLSTVLLLGGLLAACSPPQAPPAGIHTIVKNTPIPSGTGLRMRLIRAHQNGSKVVVSADVHGGRTGVCDVTFTRTAYPTVRASGPFGEQEPFDSPYTSISCHVMKDAADFFNSGTWDVEIVARAGGVTSEPIRTTVEVQR
ncbi:hypothetical protein ACLQ2R_11265 [Streptosporangium sp. DT93]|uniref:hypothetical protein n=1 Tax=Streptosporangium sp. DT93 TaxID=3393428 RepID=UPI003CEABF0F